MSKKDLINFEQKNEADKPLDIFKNNMNTKSDNIDKNKNHPALAPAPIFLPFYYPFYYPIYYDFPICKKNYKIIKSNSCKMIYYRILL